MTGKIWQNNILAILKLSHPQVGMEKNSLQYLLDLSRTSYCLWLFIAGKNYNANLTCNG